MLLLFFICITVTNAVVSYRDSIILDEFSEWLSKHNIKSKNDVDLARIFLNWIVNNKYNNTTL